MANYEREGDFPVEHQPATEQRESGRYYLTTNKNGILGRKRYKVKVGGDLIAPSGSTGSYWEKDDIGWVNIRAYSSPEQTTSGFYTPAEGLRLFAVEGTPTDGFTAHNYSEHEGAFKKVRVVEELPTWMVFGPNGKALEFLIDTLQHLPPERLHKIAKADDNEVIFKYVKDKTDRNLIKVKRDKANRHADELISRMKWARTDFGIQMSVHSAGYIAVAAIIAADLLTSDELLMQLKPVVAGMNDKERKEFYSLLPQNLPQGQQYKVYGGEWVSDRFTHKRPLQVSGREEFISESLLMLPEGTVFQGTTVSVGEGLAAFAKSHNAIAVDPLYQVEGIVTADMQELKERIEFGYNGRVVYRSDYQAHKDNIAHLDRRKMVAGVAEALPFADNTIDTLLGSELLFYIDIPTTIREFIRVIKDTGEIRLSGDRVQVCVTNKGTHLIPGAVQHNSFIGNNFYTPAQGWSEAMQLLQKEGYNVYVVSTDRTDVTSTDQYHAAGVFIIRKDDTLPAIRSTYDERVWERISSDERERERIRQTTYANLGTLYKVDLTPDPVKDEEYPHVFSLQPLTEEYQFGSKNGPWRRPRYTL